MTGTRRAPAPAARPGRALRAPPASARPPPLHARARTANRRYRDRAELLWPRRRELSEIRGSGCGPWRAPSGNMRPRGRAASRGARPRGLRATPPARADTTRAARAADHLRERLPRACAAPPPPLRNAAARAARQFSLFYRATWFCLSLLWVLTRSRNATPGRTKASFAVAAGAIT